MPDRFHNGRQALDQLAPTTDLWEDATRRASRGVQVDDADVARPERRFLVAAVLVTIALVGVGTLVAQQDDDVTQQMSGAAFPSRLPVPPVGDAQSGQLRDATPVWVVHHQDGTVSVIDAVSAHKPFGMGQLVGWCASSRGFEDPQHGSQFDERGKNRGGPAPRPLPHFSIGSRDSATVTVVGRAPASPPVPVEGEAPAGNHCYGTDLEDGRSYNPGSLELHALAEARGMTLAEALDLPYGELLIIRDAPILLVPGRTTVVCSGPVSTSNPPACDGVEAPGLELGDGMALVIAHGTFAARIIDSTVQPIAFISGWTDEGPAPARDCGRYVIEQGDLESDENHDAQQCLIDAFSTGEPATLTYESPTIEGDPIITHLRVTGKGTVEIVTDMRRDPFSSGGIHTQTCTELTIQGRLMRTDQCTPAEDM